LIAVGRVAEAVKAKCEVHVARLEPIGSGVWKSAKESNAMEKDPPTIVEAVWQQVGTRFQRFCLAAGIATPRQMIALTAYYISCTRWTWQIQNPPSQ
jgi:hypothetical protein